jgi:hypothetical protein
VCARRERSCPSQFPGCPSTSRERRPFAEYLQNKPFHRIRPPRGKWLTACSLVGMPRRFLTQPRSSRNDPRACRAFHAFPSVSHVGHTHASRRGPLESAPLRCPIHEITSEPRVVHPARLTHRRFTPVDFAETAGSRTLPPPFSSSLPRSLSMVVRCPIERPAYLEIRFAPCASRLLGEPLFGYERGAFTGANGALRSGAPSALHNPVRTVAHVRETRRVSQWRPSLSTSRRASAHAHDRR